MTSTQLNETALLHIRFQGRSFDTPLQDLSVGNRSSDQEIKKALGRYLNLSDTKFRDYVIDRHETGNLTLRPEAVFG